MHCNMLCWMYKTHWRRGTKYLKVGLGMVKEDSSHYLCISACLQHYPVSTHTFLWPKLMRVLVYLIYLLHSLYLYFLILHQFAYHIKIIQHLNFTWLFCLRVWQNGLGPSWTTLYSLCTHFQLFVLHCQVVKWGGFRQVVKAADYVR